MGESNDNDLTTNIAIKTKDQIKINIEYLSWLCGKSKERKKQNQGLMKNTRRAIELVIRDAGGEKALKELYLKEQNEKVINKLSKSNPTITEAFKGDRETVLQTLNELLPNLVNN
ncbi:MAG: hypothetical protein M3261_05615 [Thermoproteota archaeon]|nr:hypothetical protein [Thermoproteota archaeon]